MVRISPDRSQIALVPAAPGELTEVVVVPTDGGPARTFTTGREQRGITEGTTLSWTADSRTLIIGDTAVGRRTRDERHRSRVLTCDTAALPAECRAIPGIDGLAAPLPGGIVTSSSVGSVVPFATGPVDATRPGQRWLRLTVDRRSAVQRRMFTMPRRTRTAFVTDTPRTLRDRTASLASGIDAAVAVVGGTDRAVVVHQRHRAPISRNARVNWRVDPMRWTLIDANGTFRTITAPTITVRERSRAGRRSTSRHAVVLPRVSRPSGGWLAEVRVRTSAVTTALALATVTADGHPTLVRPSAPVLTGDDLARTPLGRRPDPGSGSVALLGHEAATDAAVVVVRWGEQDRRAYRYRRATVRVPLDGRTPPSVISRSAEDEVW
ncbi:MAG: hypothetical protein ITG02_07250 [Patulibacter sp.]|nr:hypothetical protein [Patulibacter sp.]